MGSPCEIIPAADDSIALRGAIAWHNMAADSGDPWGSVMGSWFDVAEEICRRGGACPESWLYRPGAMGPADAEGEFALMLADLNTGELVDLGRRLEAAADAVKAAGRDY